MGGIELHDHWTSLKAGVVYNHVHFIFPEGKLLQPRNREGNWRSLRFLYELNEVFQDVVLHTSQVDFNVRELLISLYKSVD